MMTQFPLEAGLNEALWYLFSSEGPSKLANSVLVRQLEERYPNHSALQSFKRKVAAGAMRAYQPPTAPAPDLALIGPDDLNGNAEILAVVEVKIGASGNVPLRSSADGMRLISDPEAVRIRLEAFEVDTFDRASQIDLYRAYEWWPTDSGLKLTDATDVLWLLFDVKNRAAETVFESVAPAEWLTVDLRRFAADLDTARSQEGLSRDHSDLIAVVTWHINLAAKKLGLGEAIPTARVPA